MRLFEAPCRSFSLACPTPLPRYAREWNYRFNRRHHIADLTDFLLRRAAARSTITYRQLVKGAQLNGAALPALTG